MAGSDFLNTTKGTEFQTQLESEIETGIKQFKLRNRKLQQKDLFEAIQKQVDKQIKPKINALLDNRVSQEDEGETKKSRYEFRNLKEDLEAIGAKFMVDYPEQLVHQKIFEITFQMSELLLFVNKQMMTMQSKFALERVKQLEKDNQDIKKEFSQEKEDAREHRYQAETALLKAESERAVAVEKKKGF